MPQQLKQRSPVTATLLQAKASSAGPLPFSCVPSLPATAVKVHTSPRHVPMSGAALPQDLEALEQPLLSPEEPHHLEQPPDEASHSAEGRSSRGWLAEQLQRGAAVLRESPDIGGGAAAALLPAGYQQPKLSARSLARHPSMAHTRAR